MGAAASEMSPDGTRQADESGLVRSRLDSGAVRMGRF